MLSPIKLSICIATFNRAQFLAAALESIISQATRDCEVVVSDNASTDETENVVAEYARRFERLRYIKQDVNRGLDCNFDCAVEFACGEYCWLFSDDDLMKPGAVANVLEQLGPDYSLVLVNGEHRDFTMSTVRVPNFFGITSNRIYDVEEMDRLFTEVGTCLMCLCVVVIKRAIWMARERRKYYGSWFIQVGVILQERLPGKTLVIAEPLLCFRLGNVQTGMAKEIAFHTWCISWPSLIWTFPLAESTKRRFSTRADSWRRLRYLLAYRAQGNYSLEDYRRWVRPRLRTMWQVPVPWLVAHVPSKLASKLFAVCSLIIPGANSPHEILAPMYPASLAALRASDA